MRLMVDGDKWEMCVHTHAPLLPYPKSEMCVHTHAPLLPCPQMGDVLAHACSSFALPRLCPRTHTPRLRFPHRYISCELMYKDAKAGATSGLDTLDVAILQARLGGSVFVFTMEMLHVVHVEQDVAQDVVVEQDAQHGVQQLIVQDTSDTEMLTANTEGIDSAIKDKLEAKLMGGINDPRVQKLVEERMAAHVAEWQKTVQDSVNEQISGQLQKHLMDNVPFEHHEMMREGVRRELNKKPLDAGLHRSRETEGHNDQANKKQKRKKRTKAVEEELDPVLKEEL